VNKPYELAEYLATGADIDAPLAVVWPLYLNMNRWYTDYHWDWISGPPYGEIGLQEGQVLKASPLYGAGLNDPSLFYHQEQLKVTQEEEIVVKLTTPNPKAISAEYGAEVYDLVAFYHWDFSDNQGRTKIGVRSYSNIRMAERPSASIISDLTSLFYRSWCKCLNNLAALATATRSHALGFPVKDTVYK
jgi:hypothetical protein